MPTGEGNEDEDVLGADEGDAAEDAETADTDADDDATAEAEPSRQTAEVPAASPTEAVRQNAAQTGRSTESTLPILPLGSGLILVGLGLGLAFLGLRLRRG